MNQHISHDKVTRLRATRTAQAGFSWHKVQANALTKLLQISILLRNNPDYQIKYPNECRNLNSCDVKTHVHPDAKKRIVHDFQKKILAITPPTIQRPVRLNRTVG